MLRIGQFAQRFGLNTSGDRAQTRTDFGEQEVVLAGIAVSGGPPVANPMQGTLERGTRIRINTGMPLLGRRALGGRR